jgi:hypothetical protein
MRDERVRMRELPGAALRRGTITLPVSPFCWRRVESEMAQTETNTNRGYDSFDASNLG